jgi:hypothetical protein
MVNPGSRVSCFTKPGTLPCHFNPNFNPELYMAEFNGILTTMEIARAWRYSHPPRANSAASRRDLHPTGDLTIARRQAAAG